jgi:hypothetical protein
MFRIGVPEGVRPWIGAAILCLFVLALGLPFGSPCEVDGVPVAGSPPTLNGAFYFLLLGLEPLVAWRVVHDHVQGVPFVTLVNFALIGLALLALLAICLMARKTPPAWLGLAGGLATLTALHPTFLGEFGFFTPTGPGAIAWGAGSLLAVSAGFLRAPESLSPR